MEVTVLFFGATADTIGLRELQLTVKETATVQSVVNELSQWHPALANHKLLIAVNAEYVDADSILNEGDEIAIFTAVSGG